MILTFSESKVHPCNVKTPNWSFHPALWECVEALEDDPGQGIHQIQDFLGRDLKSWREFQYKKRGFGFTSEDGQVFQIRYLHNEADPEQRYDAPQRAGTRIYRPPVPAQFRQVIGDRAGVFIDLDTPFWDQVRDNPCIPIVDCEGPAKALTMIGLGYAAITGYGAFAGLETNEWRSYKKPKNRRRRNSKASVEWEKIPIKPRLPKASKELAVPGRVWILVPDQDISPTTRFQVLGAFRQRGLKLKEAGCDVRIALWNPSLGKGIDDVHGQHGEQVVQQIIDNAIPLEEWLNQDLLDSKLPDPSETVKSRSMDQAQIILPPTGLVYSDAAMGTGKTKLIAKVTDGRSMIAPYPLKSLAKVGADKLDAVYRNTSKKRKDGLLYSKEGELADRLTLCYDSLGRLDLNRQFAGEPAQDLVLDEITHGLRHMLMGATCKQERLPIMQQMIKLIRDADRIIAFDADLTKAELDFIRSIRGKDEEFYIKNLYQGEPWAVEFLQTGNVNVAIEELASRISGNKLWHWATDGLSTSYKIQEYLNSIGISSVVVNSETVEEQNPLVMDVLMSRFDSIKNNAQVIVTSPSVIQGVSWEEDLFGGVIGAFTGCSINPRQMAQALGRVRHPVNRYIWASEHRMGGDRFSSCYTKKTAKRQLVDLLGYTGRRLNNGVSADEAMAKGLDGFAALIAEDNKMRSRPRMFLKGLLESRGHQITTTECVTHSGDQYKEAAVRVRGASLRFLSESEALSESELKQIGEADVITKEQRIRRQRYLINKEWALPHEQVNTTHIHLSMMGIGDAIKYRMGWLCESYAKDCAAKTIGGMPWDIDPLMAKVDILKATGLQAVMDMLELREMTSKSPELIAYRDKCWEMRKPIKDYLNYTMRRDASPMEVIGWFLDQLGLKLTRRASNGTRYYKLDMSTEYNAMITAAVERRISAWQQEKDEEEARAEAEARELGRPRKGAAKPFVDEEWIEVQRLLLGSPTPKQSRPRAKPGKGFGEVTVPVGGSARRRR
jgi:hypothetical protein